MLHYIKHEYLERNFNLSIFFCNRYQDQKVFRILDKVYKMDLLFHENSSLPK